FEAEKSGYKILVENNEFDIQKQESQIRETSAEEKTEYLREIEYLQTEIYGEKISNNEKERQTIVSLCNHTFNKNKDKISHEEQQIFQNFLNKFKDDIQTYSPPKIPRDNLKGKLSIDEIMNATEHIKTNFYPNIQRGQKQEKGKTAYSADFQTKVRKYPDKKEDVFSRILTTIGHEDGGHMIRSDNQEKNKLLMAGSGYEDIEEGITKLNEGLLKYSLDNYVITPNDTFISVFIGENYNFEDSYKLIRVLKKLNNKSEINDNKISTLAFNLTQRVKGYYPRDMPGSNRKDVIYFRGEKKLVEYLKSLPSDEERAIFYRKAMSAKVSFEDIFTLDELFKELGGDSNNINYNKLVDKVFNIKLKEGAGAFNKKASETGKTNIEENLLKGDFRFNGMKEYTDQEKKALVDLFTMVKYKKYRGKYYQEEKRQELKNKDNLKIGHIISFKDAKGNWKKGKVIKSSLSTLTVVLQENGVYKNSNIETIQKKDIQKLEDIRILNKLLQQK
ncbi:MAG: hypothetical protein WCO66_05360, partial [Candidatus Absconditabacteria bacterium]